MKRVTSFLRSPNPNPQALNPKPQTPNCAQVTDEESDLLFKIPSSDFPAKGMCFSLEYGKSGYDVGHWRKLVFMISTKGDLVCQTYEDLKAKKTPTKLLNVTWVSEITRTSYGVVVPFGIQIEIGKAFRADKDDPPIVIGFYSREEQGLWIEDLDNTFKKIEEEKLMILQVKFDHMIMVQN